MQLKIERQFDGPSIAIQVILTAQEKALLEENKYLFKELLYDPSTDVPTQRWEPNKFTPPMDLSICKLSSKITIFDVINDELIRPVNRAEMDYAYDAIVKRCKGIAQFLREQGPDGDIKEVIDL